MGKTPLTKTLTITIRTDGSRYRRRDRIRSAWQAAHYIWTVTGG